MFSHSHAPSFCLFMSLFPSREGDKHTYFPKRSGESYKKTEFLMEVYNINTLTDCRWLSASPPGWVHPNFEGRAVLVRGSPHQHSCVWVVHCWSSETQPKQTSLPPPFIYASHTAGGRTNRRKNFHRVISLFENFWEAPSESQWHLTCHILIVQFLLAHQMTNSI